MPAHGLVEHPPAHNLLLLDAALELCDLTAQLLQFL